LGGPKYLVGVAEVKNPNTNFPVMGTSGNISIPAGSLVTKVTMTGSSDLQGGGTTTLEANASLTSGGAPADGMGGPHAWALVADRITDLQSTSILGTPVDSWLNVYVANESIAKGTVNVSVEYF
jgi:hypothetical protein